ncbi:putative effector protein [Ceratobasidium theobromae]|uniref:Putative effector protein n=1 Tax=Ceratobasidium theobromae TaxID=1582974 RepID=A0A5N5QMK2_9AGAM|nr:putative effector protein [Ceratobasidium theobromae]
MLFLVSVLAYCVTIGFASPLQLRAAPDNTVLIRSETEYCMIMPRQPHTNIGDSESDGQMQAFCSALAQSNLSQGVFPDSFWHSVTFASGTGQSGQPYVQLTGCINPGFSQLNDGDGGGQYDSSGGDGGQGNPQGSACEGYNHYVELVEPDVGRACIRCCNDYNDCPLDRDTAGCPNVIQGNYSGCE